VWFTDGVTEAVNAEDEEFGEERLVRLLVENRGLSAEELHNKVLETVCEFSHDNFQDDVTLIVMSVS
jgi:phosphoserine phosphatase RsbU/P